MLPIQVNKRKIISDEIPRKKMKLSYHSRNNLSYVTAVPKAKDTTLLSCVYLNHTSDEIKCQFELLPSEITTDILMTYLGIHNIIDLLQLSFVSKHFHKIVSFIVRHLTPSLQYQYHHNPLEKLSHNESNISLLVRHVQCNKRVSTGLLEIQNFFNPCVNNTGSLSEKRLIHHLLQKALELLTVRCINSIEEKKLHLVGKLAGYSYKVAKEEMSYQASVGFSCDSECHDIYRRSCLVMQIFLLKKNRLHKCNNLKRHDSKFLNKIESIENIAKY